MVWGLPRLKLGLPMSLSLSNSGRVSIWSAEPAMLANYAWASKIRPGRPQCLLSFGRTSRHSLVGGATCRKTPISRSTLEKNPMPAHLFEGKPVDEGTTRRGPSHPTPQSGGPSLLASYSILRIPYSALKHDYDPGEGGGFMLLCCSIPIGPLSPSPGCAVQMVGDEGCR